MDSYAEIKYGNVRPHNCLFDHGHDHHHHNQEGYAYRAALLKQKKRSEKVQSVVDKVVGKSKYLSAAKMQNISRSKSSKDILDKSKNSLDSKGSFDS